MDTVFIFRWEGEYYGFLCQGRLYDRQGMYQGWLDSKRQVWRWDGSHLGELKHENYILRNLHRPEADPKFPKPYPHPPLPPEPRKNRPPKPPLTGWADALAPEADAEEPPD